MPRRFQAFLVSRLESQHLPLDQGVDAALNIGARRP
jgi:hypothetical protein